jgi:hypothetical protein
MNDDLLPCVTTASFWAPRHLIRSAWLEHAPFAFWLVQASRPRAIVELGTHFGFSYLVFCQAVAQLGLPARCHAIDTWEGDAHSGYYGNEVFLQLNSVNQEHYGSFSRLMRARFDQALAGFGNGEIDLLHIDGGHLYEDVLGDFVNWAPKLSDRAVVLFHDTNVRERDFGVWKLWVELSAKYPSFEFTHGNGLGVLGVGRNLPRALSPLFHSRPETGAAIRAAYARLGAAVSLQSILANAQSTVDRLLSDIGARDAVIEQLQRGGMANRDTVMIR